MQSIMTVRALNPTFSVNPYSPYDDERLNEIYVSWQKDDVFLKVGYVRLSVKRSFILSVAYPQLNKCGKHFKKFLHRIQKETLLTKSHTCKKENLSIPDYLNNLKVSVMKLLPSRNKFRMMIK